MDQDFTKFEDYSEEYLDSLISIWRGENADILADSLEGGGMLDLEEAIYGLKLSLILTEAEGEILDRIGRVFGEPRIESNDEKYRKVIRAKVQALAARGSLAEVWSAMTTLIDGEVGILDDAPASYRLLIEVEEAISSAEVKRLTRFLRILTPVGIRFSAVEGEKDIFRFDTGEGFDLAGFGRELEI